MQLLAIMRHYIAIAMGALALLSLCALFELKLRLDAHTGLDLMDRGLTGRRERATIAVVAERLMSKSITFKVEEDEGYLVASWTDAASPGGITTQARNMVELLPAIREAIECHFDEEERPTKFVLHFINDPAFELSEAA
jgi:hypothetical protein